MKKVKKNPFCILFDLDGTLADTIPQLALAAQAAARAIGISEPSLETTKGYVGNGVNLLLARVIKGKFDVQLEDVDPLVLKEARNAFNIEYTKGLDKNFTLYDGVKDGLSYLKSLNIKLAVVTNKPQVFAIPLLGYMGIYDYFDFVLGGEILKERKPSPEPINFVLQNLGIQNHDAMMVGDSDNDIIAGNKALVSTVFLTYGYNRADISTLSYDFKCDSFKEFIDLFIKG